MLLNYQIFIETLKHIIFTIIQRTSHYNANQIFLLVKLKLKEKNEVHHGNGTWICNNVFEKITIRDHIRDAKKEYES